MNFTTKVKRSVCLGDGYRFSISSVTCFLSEVCEGFAVFLPVYGEIYQPVLTKAGISFAAGTVGVART